MPKMAKVVRDNAAEYRRQLLAYALKVCKDHDIAEELVQWAFAAVLDSDAEYVDGEAIWYLCHVLKLRFFNVRAGKSILSRQRKGHRSQDDLVGEMQKLVTQPNQVENAELAQVARLMEKLPARQREALTLAGLGYDNTAVAKKMGITRVMAQAAMKAGRQTLCEAMGRDPRPSGYQPRSGYRGVRKNVNKWVATHATSKLGVLYLGSFDTAEEAALAFDMAALARVGDKATLNFPELKEELRAKLAA
jgi:DNA-directed RNA polymerase specialized sigma24 family protein